MKDSQHARGSIRGESKYIKVNNERFSTNELVGGGTNKYIKVNNERFSTNFSMVARPV